MKDRKAKKILVVDDEKDTVEMIATLLELEGYRVLSAFSGREAMSTLEAESQKISESETPVDLILLDILLGDADGRDICQKVKENEKLKFIPVIILTVRSSLQDKINSLNLGADDYLTKPFINEELLAKVKVMLRIKDLHDELKREKDKNILLSRALEKRYSFGNILGKNARMQEVYEFISDIADTDSTVLIQGESGTGKELIARAIHFNSHRKTNPLWSPIVLPILRTYWKVNSSAMKKGLLRVPFEERLAGLKWRMEGRSFSMRSVRFPLPPRFCFSGSYRIIDLRESVGRKPWKWMSG